MQKSEKVVLRLAKKNNWGKIVVLPTLGETKIGEDGNIEVEDTVATLLLTKTNSFLLVKGNGTTVTEELYSEKLVEEVAASIKEKEVTPIKEEKAESESKKDESDEDESKEEDGLDEMTLSELKEIAEQAGFAEEDYSKYAKSKKLMVNFLRKNAK